MQDDSSAHCSSGLVIRRATHADVAGIRSVLYSVRSEYGVLSDQGADDPELDDFESSFFGRGGYFEVVEDSRGRILGCAGLYPLNQQRAEVCKMYLIKAARGHGLGKRLLNDLLEAARRNGFREVWLETNRLLTEASPCTGSTVSSPSNRTTCCLDATKPSSCASTAPMTDAEILSAAPRSARFFDPATLFGTSL